MALGAYSVVRFSDNFRDERVNIGVVVWHPVEGFQWRFSRTLDRIKAVSPAAEPIPLRRQLSEIKERLREANGNGREVMTEMSNWLREGLEFSKPYPTRLVAASETANRLFDMLIPRRPAEPLAKASFEVRLQTTLRAEAERIAPGSLVEHFGDRWIGGLRVNPGLHTRVREHEMLWRPVSMRRQSHSDQIASAKSAVLDIQKLRAQDEFQRFEHVVTLDAPDRFAGAGYQDSKRWLEDARVTVLRIASAEEMQAVIREKLLAAA